MIYIFVRRVYDLVDTTKVAYPREELFLGYLFLTVESEREESKTIYIPS